MRRRRIPLLVRIRLLIAASAALLAAGIATPLIAAPSGQTLADECRANTPGGFERGCRSAEQVAQGFAAECRRRAPDPATCEPIDGRNIGPARMADYAASWVPRALALQRGLAAGHPLMEEQILHTHNSFNSSSYSPTLTNQDANQVYGLTDQLDMGIRFLELDLHWVPSIFGSPATGGYWVTLCHGNSDYSEQVHIGCSNDRPMQDGLAEIKAWLDAHPGEFVFIYLENQMNGDPKAHDVAAGLIDAAFPSPLVYRTPAGDPCADMPYETSRADMAATGARVLLVGNCGPGAWGGLVHDRGAKWNEGGDPTTYGDLACGADSADRLDHDNFRRYFMDSTWVTAMVDGENSQITPETAARMTACGVNMIGVDQLRPDDGRLAAQVWSWTPEEAMSPSGDCAVQLDGGRLAGRGCTTPHAFACLTTTGDWAVTTATGPWSDGPSACDAEFPGSSFSAPWNGLRNALLAAAHPGADLWLDYAVVGGAWTPEAAG